MVLRVSAIEALVASSPDFADHFGYVIHGKNLMTQESSVPIDGAKM